MLLRVLGALIGALLIQSQCLAAGQCRTVYRAALQRAKLGVMGAVFEPIAPSRPWGPNLQYKADIRDNAVMLFSGLKDPSNILQSDFAFNNSLAPYNDSPGNGYNAQLQIGLHYEMYLRGLQEIWSHYDVVLGPEAGSTNIGMQSIVQTSFNARTSFISVWSERSRNGELLGFTRIFDGTDYSKLSVQPYSWKRYYGPMTPAEYSLSLRGVKTNYFDQLRKQGYHIFEIGKYFLSDKIDPENRDHVRSILHKFWQENFMDERFLLFPERTVFILHTGSEKLKEHYEEVFGAKDIPKESIVQGQLKPTEHILVVDLKTIREKLGFGSGPAKESPNGSGVK